MCDSGVEYTVCVLRAPVLQGAVHLRAQLGGGRLRGVGQPLHAPRAQPLRRGGKPPADVAAHHSGAAAAAGARRAGSAAVTGWPCRALARLYDTVTIVRYHSVWLG